VEDGQKKSRHDPLSESKTNKYEKELLCVQRIQTLPTTQSFNSSSDKSTHCGRTLLPVYSLEQFSPSSLSVKKEYISLR